jgi:hypothetical protein
MDVSDTTLNDVDGLVPKLTDVAPENPLPLITVTLPPVLGPLEGVTEIILGALSRLTAQKSTIKIETQYLIDLINSPL